MTEVNEDEKEEAIKYSDIFGLINIDSNLWDDNEFMGEKELLKYKIVKIKIYTGSYSNKQVIFGLSYVFRNLDTHENINEQEHKPSEEFIDVKEFEIKNQEFLTDFHIRFPNGGDYITQLGFETNKKRKFYVGTLEGEDKKIETNGGDNIIIGTFGRIKRKLDALGVLTITKLEYFKRRSFSFFILRYKIKKDDNFKKQWDEKHKDLPIEYKYIWKVANLPDLPFAQIIKYCCHL